MINNWILSHDKIRQEKYLNLMNKWSEEGNNGDEIIDVDQETERAGRKRRRRETEKTRQKIMPFKIKPAEYSKTISSTYFKMVTIKVKCGIQRRLIIFTTAEKEMCYEYTCKNQIYFCFGCRKQYKQITAIMGYDDEKDEEYVKLIIKEHFCKPLPYDPEKYTEIITLKKPEYQFFDNCSTFTRKILFIFHPSNPNLCYKYFWKTLEGKFYCCGCHVKKKATAAEIFNENKENEFIRLLHTDHICEYINYEPEKYTSFNNFVVKPDFEIQTKITNGNRKLIIFDKNDRNLCYIYYDRATRLFL